jgi:hypothetical protein
MRNNGLWVGLRLKSWALGPGSGNYEDIKQFYILTPVIYFVKDSIIPDFTCCLEYYIVYYSTTLGRDVQV